MGAGSAIHPPLASPGHTLNRGISIPARPVPPPPKVNPSKSRRRWRARVSLCLRIHRAAIFRRAHRSARILSIGKFVHPFRLPRQRPLRHRALVRCLRILSHPVRGLPKRPLQQHHPLRRRRRRPVPFPVRPFRLVRRRRRGKRQVLVSPLVRPSHRVRKVLVRWRVNPRRVPLFRRAQIWFSV